MLNPDLELDRLRWRLFDSGWQGGEVDQICNDAREEINDLILDIVANAVAEATDYATEIGAEDFIREMTVVPSANSFAIWTLTGNTDYTKPEQKMLPHLLKNAEVSKDGTLYKVIPIKQKASQPTSIFEAMKERSKEVESARAAIKARASSRSSRANDMADQFRQSLSKTLQNKTSAPDTASGPVTFRTATNRQNANTDWVIPERPMDMTQFLMGINSRIESTVNDSVTVIIQSYEKEYL